jgi:hypothetical protein
MSNNQKHSSLAVSLKHQTVVFLILSLVVRAKAWPFRSNKTPTVMWEEEDETHLVDPALQDKGKLTSKHRDLIWLFGPPRNKIKRTESLASQSIPNRQSRPHPLRTEQWILQVNWRNTTIHSSHEYSEKTNLMHVDFAENGYLRASFDQKRKQFTLGQWEMVPTGLKCIINSTLLFHADLHINPFGQEPRLTKGVIIDNASRGWRDRRVIIGTFTGHGVGRDTVDLSYSKRKN